MSDEKKGNRMQDGLSRRSVLGMGSAALAAATLAGFTAHAQTREGTRQAEGDHSSSNPGQENNALLAENPNSNTPPPTDNGDVGPIWYSFDLTKKRIQEGGWTHQVTQRELPSSTDLAGVNMRLTAGSFRELHWHTADEWSIMLYGNARVTVLNPDGTIFIDDVSKGDLWYFPAGNPHSIQGLGPDGCEFLLVFDDGRFSEDDTTLLSSWLRHTPPGVLAKNWQAPESAIQKPYDIGPGGKWIFQADLPPALEQDQKAAAQNKPLSPHDFAFRLMDMKPT